MKEEKQSFLSYLLKFTRNCVDNILFHSTIISPSLLNIHINPTKNLSSQILSSNSSTYWCINDWTKFEYIVKKACNITADILMGNNMDIDQMHHDIGKETKQGIFLLH